MCGPASMVPPSAFTVIVSTWFVPTALVAVAGVIWMFAFTQTLLALPLPPAAVLTAVFVVRVIVWPATGMSDVAETTVVPDDGGGDRHGAGGRRRAARVGAGVAAPTKLPGPLTIDAVAVCGPASIVPPSALIVIVSTWFVPTVFVSRSRA